MFVYKTLHNTFIVYVISWNTVPSLKPHVLEHDPCLMTSFTLFLLNHEDSGLVSRLMYSSIDGISGNCMKLWRMWVLCVML